MDRPNVEQCEAIFHAALSAAQRREQSEPSKSPKQDVTNGGRYLTEDAP